MNKQNKNVSRVFDFFLLIMSHSSTGILRHAFLRVGEYITLQHILLPQCSFYLPFACLLALACEGCTECCIALIDELVLIFLRSNSTNVFKEGSTIKKGAVCFVSKNSLWPYSIKWIQGGK